MEKITSKAELLERIKDVRAVEMVARDSYVADIEAFQDHNIKNTIKNIKNDEDNHIGLLDEIINLLNK